MDREKLVFVNISEFEELLDIAKEIREAKRAGINPDFPADILEYAERAELLVRYRPGLVFRAIVEDWPLDAIVVAIDDFTLRPKRESLH